MTARLVRFLLVEDDDDHADLVAMALSDNQVGNEIDRVRDGAEALAYLRREGEYADKPQPDVVLLDLKLPKVGGLEVLAEVKSDASLRSIPIVMLTTSRAEIDKSKAYGQHANSYLVKPVDFGRFNQMVKDLSMYWGVWNESRA